ncbi:GyrI-like domain-containing protein [Balneolaceae bacterium ANBcel3]|nr:GyrI-like domain-containing protein [Balneolaceae bacterium ANBcel3]
MNSLNLATSDRDYYSAKKTPELKTFSKRMYLALSGIGDPSGPEFKNAIQCLYALAYGVRSICKQQASNFVVPKLEALWWVCSENHFSEIPKSQWQWKLLIQMPEFVSSDIVEQAKMDVIKKAGEAVKEIGFESLSEGSCVQILHIGPYSEELPTIQTMKAFISEHGLSEHGLHHEIYLSDPRKSPPERLKTILRQPVS